MTFDDYIQTLTRNSPPPGLDPLLSALWYDAKGDWSKAHAMAQDIETRSGAWVHAYLHRKEGDDGNAAYWYKRADRPIALVPLEDEWSEIVRELIER